MIRSIQSYESSRKSSVYPETDLAKVESLKLRFFKMAVRFGK